MMPTPLGKHQPGTDGTESLELALFDPCPLVPPLITTVVLDQRELPVPFSTKAGPDADSNCACE